MQRFMAALFTSASDQTRPNCSSPEECRSKLLVGFSTVTEYQTQLTYKEKRSKVKPAHCFGPLVGTLDIESGECVPKQLTYLMAKSEEEGPRASQSLQEHTPEPIELPLGSAS